MNENISSRNYYFRYVSKPDRSLYSWWHFHKPLETVGKIEYFYGMLCPVCIAEIDVSERTRGEYDTIEFLILKLVNEGISDAELLCSLTGLNIAMVKNILDVLENSYGHIKDGKVTEDGEFSLQAEHNIQCYETTRQIQLEGITGCVLIPELYQTWSSDYAYLDSGDNKIIKYMPTESIMIDFQKDIADNLNKYQEYEAEIIDRNIEKIHDMKIEGSISIECFLVKYDFLPHPFLIFPLQETKDIKWIPVAISQTNKKILDEHGLSLGREILVCRDDMFDRLGEIEEEVRAYDEQHLDIKSTFKKTRGKENKNQDYTIADKKDETSVPIVYEGARGKVVYCNPLKKDKEEDE